MRRLFWVVLGAVAGVLIVRKLSTTARAYTPEGLGRSVAAVTDILRDLTGAVREGMAEREQELRVALGVDTGDVDPEQVRGLLEDPMGPGSR